MDLYKTYLLQILFILSCVCMESVVYAQQIPVYTMGEFAAPKINPAYAGNESNYDVIFMSRQQWVGFKGAPRSYLLAANVPLRSRKAGVGFDIQHQSAGPFQQDGFFVNYSYTINLSSNSSLSFGLKGGFNMYMINLKNLVVNDLSDYLFESDFDHKVLPNFGTGIHLKKGDYFIDFSVPMLLRSGFEIEDVTITGNLNKEERLYTLHGGAEYTLGNDIVLRPGLGFWLVKGAPPLIDMRVAVQAMDQFGLGLTYRISNALGGFVSWQVSKSILLGYAYEMPMANIFNKQSGTHEVVFGFDIQMIKQKTLSPRRF